METKKQRTLPIADRCPVCLEVYSPGSVRVLEWVNEYNLVCCSCPHCLSSTLALINLAERDGNILKLVTDLSATETLKYKNYKNININYCLELFEYLSVR